MKVALVNADLLPVPPVLGGPIEQTLFETATRITAPEIKVISRWAEALGGWGEMEGDTFFHVDVDAQCQRIKDVFGHSQGLPDREERRFAYLNGVTDLLHEIDPDVIQLHNCPEFAPYLCRQFPNKGMVLYMHNDLGSVDPRADNAVDCSDGLIFVSRYLADRFVARYPASKSKVKVIHNSVDIHRLHPRLKTSPKTQKIRRRFGLYKNRTVVFVGRTVPAKGLHCLLDAMDLVRRFLPDVKLLVIGSPLFGAVREGTFLNQMRKQAQSMENSVIFAGYVDSRVVPYYYAAADVAVVPSLWAEPFGKVVVEAMASGVPVVASRRGGIPEIVADGKEGVLVDDAEDAGMLAYQIIEMLEERAMRERLGKAARKKAAKRFSISVRLNKLQEFYKSLEETLA